MTERDACSRLQDEERSHGRHFQNERRPSGLRTGAAPIDDRLAELRSLVKRPAVQEHIAAEAALAAQEADRKGNVELADLLWRFVRRTRIRAMKLRLLAGVRRQGAA